MHCLVSKSVLYTDYNQEEDCWPQSTKSTCTLYLSPLGQSLWVVAILLLIVSK